MIESWGAAMSVPPPVLPADGQVVGVQQGPEKGAVMWKDHPTVYDLKGFLQIATRSRGSALRNPSIVRHLLAGCPTCLDQLNSLGWDARRMERLVRLCTAEVSNEAQGYD